MANKLVLSDVVVLGLGLMGSALVRRILEVKKENDNIEIGKVIIWNRSKEKADVFASEDCVIADSVENALKLSSPEGLICCMFASYEQTISVLLSPQIRPLIKGRDVACLCSGNPDEAREACATFRDAEVGHYIDGCIAGSPHVLQGGGGHIMISVEPKHEGFAKNQNEGILSCFFSQVGKLTVTEVMGSNKALDYAIVDCFMGAYLCFLNGLGMIENEGVDPELLLTSMQERYPPIVDQFRNTLPRMNQRVYDKDIVATLGTWQKFHNDRLPYLQKHQLSTHFSSFVSGVCGEAMGGSGGEGDDYVKLQEVLRFSKKEEGEGEGGGNVEGKGEE